MLGDAGHWGSNGSDASGVNATQSAECDFCVLKQEETKATVTFADVLGGWRRKCVCLNIMFVRLPGLAARL